jgi:hypothetical protein
MSITVTDGAVFAPPPADYRGRTMVTPEPDGTVVAGTTLPLLTAHA